MLEGFAEEIQECYRRVADCARGVDLARDPMEKAGFRDMQGRWLLLAHSYEFLARLSRLTDDADHRGQ